MNDGSVLTDPGFWIGVAALLLATSAATAHILRALRRRRHTRRARRAVAAERDAERVLERAGYRVEATQLAVAWPVTCGGQTTEYGLRADYLVSRNGQRYIAEVKHGAVVTQLSHGATRRQLLEYQLAYEVQGVLLVDMSRRQVHAVEFPRLNGLSVASRPQALWLPSMLACALVAALFTAYVMFR